MSIKTFSIKKLLIALSSKQGGKLMNIDMELLVQYLTLGLGVIGVFAFVVSVITQTLKDLPFLKEVQTNVVALSVSLIVCISSIIAICQYYGIVITWYYIFAASVAAFVVYLVSTGGWEKVSKIWSRTKYSKK